MTYQEIKDRLSKCETTLEKLKNVTHLDKDVKLKTEKLELLRESYLKLLKEADKGVIYTDDEKKAKDLADDGANVKLTVKERLKEQEGIKFSIEETKAIAKKVGQAVAKAINTVGDEIGHMKAKNIEENSFEIYIEYKNDAEDQFSFYIVDDTLHLVDFSFDKEISDVGVKPSGEAVVNVDVVANELVKHFKSLNETEVSEAPEGKHYIKVESTELMEALGILEEAFADTPEIKFELNDPDTIYVHGADTADMHDAVEELQQNGIIVDETSIDDDLEEGDEENTPAIDRMYNSDDWVKAQQDAQENKEVDTVGGDLDVGHQDDEPNMLKKDLYDVITYAAKLYKQLDKYDQQDGEVDFPHWWQKKVTLAREYMSAAQHYLEGEEKQPAIDQLALEEEVNERLRFLSPEKQKANDAKFEKRMALLKALEKGIELHKAGKISDEDLHNLKLKAGTISADSKFKKENASAEEEEKFHKKLDTLVHNTFGKRKEEMDENRFLAASMEDLEQVIRNLAHTGEMSEDEAIELAIRKLEAMLDGRDDMDEGRKDNDALFPDNPRLPEIKKLADKIVSMVKAEAAKGELGYIKTMEEIRYQQEDDFERTPEWNKAKGIRSDFDDYGSGTNEGIAKTQKAHSLVVAKMKELAKQYKAGDTSVIPQLKDLTAKKKQLEKQLEKDVAGKNKNQQLDTSVEEEYKGKHQGSNYRWPMSKATKDRKDADVAAQATKKKPLQEGESTCCGKCGRKHVKGTKCKTPYLKGKDHCRNN